MRKSDKYNTPYDRDMADIARRKNNRPSNTSRLVWIIIWFILIVIFV